MQAEEFLLCEELSWEVLLAGSCSIVLLVPGAGFRICCQAALAVQMDMACILCYCNPHNLQHQRHPSITTLWTPLSSACNTRSNRVCFAVGQLKCILSTIMLHGRVWIILIIIIITSRVWMTRPNASSCASSCAKGPGSASTPYPTPSSHTSPQLQTGSAKPASPRPSTPSLARQPAPHRPPSHPWRPTSTRQATFSQGVQTPWGVGSLRAAVWQMLTVVLGSRCVRWQRH